MTITGVHGVVSLKIRYIEKMNARAADGFFYG
jgi:hypothetical protein